MGHEIAHALREQISQAIVAQAAIGLGVTYEALVAMRFSCSDESKADSIDLVLAARAGCDPRAGVTLWQQMMAAKGEAGAPPEFLSSHPADASRVQQIQTLLPTVLPLYEASRKH